ncbi:MAG: autoinducer binding domain-containing protein [Magnetospirillum sp. WYHS-4]
MSYTFSDFIDRMRGLERPDPLRVAMARFAEGLGFESFMFLHHDANSGEMLLLSNYAPGWQEHYIANDYALVDPVALQVSRSTSPFCWGHDAYLARLEEPQKHLMNEAGEFGIRRGLACVWRNGGGVLSGISVTTAKSEEEFQRQVNRYRVDIELACLYFCSHVENRVMAPAGRVYGDLLTAGEKDCLIWTLQGRKVDQMAAASGMTEAGVKDCLRAAVVKLRAVDVLHAAAKAVEMGLICP